MADDKDAFAEQQAQMNAPPPPKWRPSLRSFAYALGLFLLFGIGASFVRVLRVWHAVVQDVRDQACGQLGIWSWALQKYGNIRRVEDYPNAETMQTGNMLFATSLITILVTLGAPFLPLLFLAFLLFAVFVMNIVGAGILTHQIPFEAGSCSTSNANWARFLPDCKKWVAYEALAWTAFALAFVLFCAVLADVFAFAKKRQHKRHYLLGA
ncbi:hypothetical protein JCM3775_002635 [Rhodotorula graminis]